ncbi:copper amine oxidase N-terminal domain-containing protein [Paenibacillus sp. HWE-109]|uniref:copper amine oxidase N-terminal domain-containing protein n=1 Tax=Paenibacillus sp. HWE-109 TaxID=1306526 RepID=UPI001EDE0708|nr:copper amine oxidase N-terminal domain-containing protein [Paenibacillus sp. HWE-109]UKS28559.1 copper amine oxidase N-terminal domain-containing protein [Paenibacillus sp. HWE-109]
MKKFVLGLICGIGLTATTAVYASDTIQAYLFPAKFVFNGETKELDTNENIVLNHNGHAYVPVRFVAENMGKIVKYEYETKTIFIEDTYLSKKLTIDKEFLTFASVGKIKGIEFGIGANKNDVIQNWGEPHQIGSWQTEFYRWHSYYFFFWKPDENAGAIRVNGNVIPYRLNEVRDIIGKPLSEGEGVDGGWAYVYQVGEYQVFFNADSKEGKISYLTLKKK